MVIEFFSGVGKMENEKSTMKSGVNINTSWGDDERNLKFWGFLSSLTSNLSYAHFIPKWKKPRINWAFSFSLFFLVGYDENKR